ncbi:MAG: enoyl-CoA hydratase/isomerase family protein [Pseudomonadota bacterium]
MDKDAAGSVVAAGSRRDRGVAWIEGRHPPGNALSQPVRQGLVDGVRALACDLSVDAIVLSAAGSTFFAGADIDELDRGVAAPGLLDLVRACDGAPQPVVAALHGTVYGGGVVVAYACDRRVAEEGTRFALPEVGLGLLPTFGGTQWLPRWLGVEPALALILDGQTWTAELALAHGLVDALAPAQGLDDAVHAAALAGPAKRRIGDPAQWCETPPELRAEAIQRRRDRLACSAPDFDAAWTCLEVIERGLELPIEEALRLEHEQFERLRQSAQSRRLRRLFFAERRLRRCGSAVEPAAQRVRETGDDPAALVALARRILADGDIADAELLDALIVRVLGLPRHAPSRIGTLLPERSFAPV